MPEITHRITIQAPRDRLFDLCRSPVVLARDIPAGEPTPVGGVMEGLLRPGQLTVLRGRMLGQRLWLAVCAGALHAPESVIFLYARGFHGIMEHRHILTEEPPGAPHAAAAPAPPTTPQGSQTPDARNAGAPAPAAPAGSSIAHPPATVLEQQLVWQVQPRPLGYLFDPVLRWRARRYLARRAATLRQLAEHTDAWKPLITPTPRRGQRVATEAPRPGFQL